MAAVEGLVLDSLDLNDGTTYLLLGLTMPPPAKRINWVSGGDSDGAVLDRDPLYDNRIVTARIAIVPQSTMDLALAKIAAIADKLEEAERNQTGVTLQWTPDSSTLTTGTFRCLSGEITDIPITPLGDDAGWFVKSPVITVTMTCDPFMRGAEVSGGTTSASTLPLVTVELTGVTGDVPAEGRLVITDAASQPRRLIRWGIESRYYPTSSPPSLILDSDSLVTTGYIGTGSTRTGAYDPGAAGNSVVRATLTTQSLSACSTGVQTHVGTFHVFARVWSIHQNNHLRFSWQDGEGSMRSNAWVNPAPIQQWVEVDLGIITTTTAVAGTQKWLGTIDVYNNLGTIGPLDIDYIYLVPAQEGYAEARAIYTYAAPGTLSATDPFASIVSGTALNARVAPTGGTWATSGAATDWTAADLPLSTDETMKRATTADATNGRYAILGATSYTNVEVGVDVYFDNYATDVLQMSLIARYVDANNYLLLNWGISPDGDLVAFQVDKVIAGTGTMIAYDAGPTPPALNTWYSMRLIVYATGFGVAQLCLTSSGTVISTVAFSDPVLVTAATLATGKPGFGDNAQSVTPVVTRYYDNFYVATPAAEPIVINSGRTAEIRSTMAIRPDSTNTYYGDVPGYRGSRFYVPPAGTRSRKTRIAVMARRNDVAGGMIDDQIADSTTIQALYTPRYVNVPR